MKTDAIIGTTLVVIEQKGSDAEECRERFLAGCDVYKQLAADSTRTCHLMIVGGANNGNSPETIRSWCPDDLLDVLVINNEAGNTHEKGESILEFLDANKIDTIVQVTSLYHSLRAYLTTLRSIQAHAPSVVFLNYVCDSSSLETIHFALSDEIFLAKAIDEQLSFAGNDDEIASYLESAHKVTADPGLLKYLKKRYGEASRIVEYSELGKDHLMTNMPLSEILNSYLTA